MWEQGEPTFWQQTQGCLFPGCLQWATLHEPYLVCLGPVNCQLSLISRSMVSLILPTLLCFPLLVRASHTLQSRSWGKNGKSKWVSFSPQRVRGLGQARRSKRREEEGSMSPFPLLPWWGCYPNKRKMWTCCCTYHRF